LQGTDAYDSGFETRRGEYPKIEEQDGDFYGCYRDKEE
jgi:hypothetical protein